MFTVMPQTDPGLIAFSCEGELTRDDLRQMHALLHARLDAGETPALLLDLTRFEGRAGPGAILEELWIDLIHRNDFDRIALVGRRERLESASGIADRLTRGTLRWFDERELAEAAIWARGRPACR